MFYSEEERQRLMAGPKVAKVRLTLNETGVLDQNPFFFQSGADALSQTFSRFAENVRDAAVLLADITGVENPLSEITRGEEFLAAGLVAESLFKKKAVELTLDENFRKVVAEPYFALRDLEKGEQESGFHCPEKVRMAMDGLVTLHALARAVPLVYKELHREPAPAAAIA